MKILTLLALLGMFFLRRWWKDYLVIAVLVVYFPLTHCLFGMEVRLLTPMMPYLLFFSFQGVYGIWERGRAFYRRAEKGEPL